MAGSKEHIYKVSGMHCASCEILIEKQFLTLEGVKSVDASTVKGEVVIEYEGNRPSPERLNRIFKTENYVFSDLSELQKSQQTPKKSGFFSSIVIGVVLISVFLWLNKLGLGEWLNVGSGSSLPTFFAFGLLAGISSCAALVGGLILSMSKQWSELYAGETSTAKKLQPHILFNAGRVISYLFFGSILGLVGSTFQLSLGFTSVLIIAVSILMIVIAMQMLDVAFFRKFQFSMPKSLTRYVANEKNFKGKNMPFLMGALTFFLPCGFTITSQGLALLSGNPLQGALIMGFFALGTAIPLLAIGLSSVAFSKNPHWSERFSKIAGIVVLFFALFNINSQLTVLGYGNFTDLLNGPGNNITQTGDKDLAPIVNGQQVIKMVASGSGDSPNYFKVRTGIPVRWEITGGSSLGCNNGIISNNLFEGQITLTPGQVIVKEFTPAKAGVYRFSCGMGMITGTIEVVDSPTSNISTAALSSAPAINGNVAEAATTADSNNDFPAIVDGKQVIKMEASGSGDNPNYFKVKVGIPVRWEITGGSSLGCNNGIVSNSLFDGSINLTPGQVSVKEFTPIKAGKYKFSCSMAMITGIIEVVDPNAPVADNNSNSNITPSGATGCGCGGGSGNTCTAR